VVVAANSAMVRLYWDIGRMILERQHRAGWGAKVIDRLAADLREAYPDMKGFSPRNLKYMRAFAAAWPDAEIVQRIVARLPWRQNIALLERVDRRRAFGTRTRPFGTLVAADPVPADRQSGARTARQGHQQLRGDPPSRRLRHGRTGLQGSLPV
jgi:hypothetical protein